MSRDTDLLKLTCHGCGVVFESHSRSVVYCCWECSFLNRLLRRLWPMRCPVCSAEVGLIDPSTGVRRTPEEYWQACFDFKPMHRICIRETLDSEEGEARLACRCKDCRRDRGELGPQDETPRRRPKDRAQRTSRPGAGKRTLVLERDGWICQICGLPLDSAASVVDDLYPQVDHIWPVAMGGGDELDNLRAAHRWCNWAKWSSSFLDSGPRDDEDVRAAALSRYASRNPPLMDGASVQPGQV